MQSKDTTIWSNGHEDNVIQELYGEKSFLIRGRDFLPYFLMFLKVAIVTFIKVTIVMFLNVIINLYCLNTCDIKICQFLLFEEGMRGQKMWQIHKNMPKHINTFPPTLTTGIEKVSKMHQIYVHCNGHFTARELRLSETKWLI